MLAEQANQLLTLDFSVEGIDRPYEHRSRKVVGLCAM
jgi:hypothetical protein